MTHAAPVPEDVVPVDVLPVDVLPVEALLAAEAAPELPGTQWQRPPWCPEDIVDEWGAGSFPASDPPANW